MATYSNNTTIKFNSKISVSVTGTSNTIYTVPANSYLEVWHLNASVAGASNVQLILSIDGLTLSGPSALSSSLTLGLIASSTTITAQPRIILGAGSVISYSGGTTAGGGTIKGALFSNTP